MGRPKHTKPDANQAEIVEELRSLGFDVDIVCNLPGLYDLVVSGIRWYYPNGPTCSVRVEVKREKGWLNETEVEYHDAQNHPESLIVAECADDVMKWFGRSER